MNVADEETEFTVRLKDAIGGTAQRGDLVGTVSFGPPVRKAFRAAQRASKLLDARDSFVSTLYTSVLGAGGHFSKYLDG